MASPRSGGEAGYNESQARQLSQATGMNMRQARRQIAANAGGRKPFSGRGRRSTRTNVLANMRRAANRG